MEWKRKLRLVSLFVVHGFNVSIRTVPCTCYRRTHTICYRQPSSGGSLCVTQIEWETVMQSDDNIKSFIIQDFPMAMRMALNRSISAISNFNIHQLHWRVSKSLLFVRVRDRKGVTDRCFMCIYYGWDLVQAVTNWQFYIHLHAISNLKTNQRLLHVIKTNLLKSGQNLNFT